jgi:hypothetical protein
MTDATTVNIETPAPTQGKIAAALAAFQAEIPAITKDGSADAGKYSYTYATLDKLVGILLPLLAAQEIAFTAVPDWNQLGFGLKTALIHSSGEKIEGFYPLGNPNNPAQAIGSAISYARRYALLALTGVAPAGEDDDGAAANTAQAESQTRAAAASKPAAKTAIDIRTEMADEIEGSGGLLTTDDANTVMAEAAPGKGPAEWTVTDMKKGQLLLGKLLKERKAEGGK